MGRCVHHIPGRARFRLPGIRNDAAKAEAARNCLVALPGVSCVDINRAAGSLTVTYDATQIGLDQVSACLRRGGLLGAGGSSRPHAPPALGSSLVTQAGAMFGRALFAAVLERSINRSVSALVGARFR